MTHSFEYKNPKLPSKNTVIYTLKKLFNNLDLKNFFNYIIILLTYPNGF